MFRKRRKILKMNKQKNMKWKFTKATDSLKKPNA